MASVVSWVGSIFCLFIYVIARRFALGLAAPLLLAAGLACLLLWSCVLRVPDLKKIQLDQSEELRLPPRKEPTGTPTGAADEDGSGTAGGAARGDDASAAQIGQRRRDVQQESQQCTGGGSSSSTAPPPRDESGSARHQAEDDQGNEEEKEQDQAGEPQRINASRRAADSDEESDDAPRQDEEEAEVFDPVRAKELRLEGNEFFKAGKWHHAKESYSEAIYIMPKEEEKEKAILYSNRAACNVKLERWEETVADCRLAIELDSTQLKAWLRRCTAYEQLGRWHDAAEDLKKAIELDESLRGKEARRLAALEEKAKVQFEKDKEEMMGKLKELGNMVLGKFGMNVDNFKLEQDPETGSYSIKYQN